MIKDKSYLSEADDDRWLMLNDNKDLRVKECKSILKKKGFSDEKIEAFLTKVWMSVFVENDFKFEQKDIDRSLLKVPKSLEGAQKALFKLRKETGRIPDEVDASVFGIKHVEEWVLIAHSSRKRIKTTDPTDRSYILSRGRQLMWICEREHKDKLSEPIAIALSIAFNLEADDEVSADDLLKSYDSQIKKHTLE